ncbi:MAG: putative ABC transporter permease [Roseburia sp.]|nr:putative ABC transporter permease [Roseburia sp.]
MRYTFSAWLFFFYFYCFLGWVWETCYVSVRQGKWVNRGFMRGPFLPIYGSGAIVVLIFTLPFRAAALPVFLVGMVSATVLEYFTGVAMERLFHVRYWDYSGKPLNLNGHICALSSLAWGVFSVLLTMYGHNPVERLVLRMNPNLLEGIVFALTAYISVDMAMSVREALDLKELLISLEENNEEFRHLYRRFEVLSAFYGGSLKEKSEAGLRKISTALDTGKELYDKLGESGRKHKEAPKPSLLEKLEKAKRGKEYTGMRALLRRNPYAVSRMHAHAFNEFLEFTQREENDNDKDIRDEGT